MSGIFPCLTSFSLTFLTSFLGGEVLWPHHVKKTTKPQKGEVSGGLNDLELWDSETPDPGANQ